MKWQDMWKRIFDIVLASIGILLLSPLFILVIVYIAFCDSTPFFYTQERLGRDMAPFKMFKFRTMRKDADKDDSSKVTLANDPRIYPGGELLRRYKIDELPQLFNVLLGDMSIVGPRPTVAEDFAHMTVEQKRRADVRPGLTGLAQINGNTLLSWPDRLHYDIYYVDNHSFWMDLKIICRTALLLFTGQVETHPPGDSEWIDG